MFHVSILVVTRNPHPEDNRFLEVHQEDHISRELEWYCWWFKKIRRSPPGMFFFKSYETLNIYHINWLAGFLNHQQYVFMDLQNQETIPQEWFGDNNSGLGNKHTGKNFTNTKNILKTLTTKLANPPPPRQIPPGKTKTKKHIHSLKMNMEHRSHEALVSKGNYLPEV